MATVYGGIARAVAPVLNAVARDCELAGEPDLSTLVVLSGTGLPGRLHGRVVDPEDVNVRPEWRKELQLVRTYAWPESTAG